MPWDVAVRKPLGNLPIALVGPIVAGFLMTVDRRDGELLEKGLQDRRHVSGSHTESTAERGECCLEFSQALDGELEVVYVGVWGLPVTGLEDE
jgi:hypothetical protein